MITSLTQHLIVAASLACITAAATVHAQPSDEAQFNFYLVESLNPNYQLAETYVVGINSANIGVGNDTFGGFKWTAETDKSQLPFNSVRGINNLGWALYGSSLYHTETGQQINIPAPSDAYPNRSLRGLNENMIAVGVATYSGPGCEPFNCPYDCGSAFVWDAVNGSRHVGLPNLKAFHAVNNGNVAVGVVIVNCDDYRGIVYDLETDGHTNLSDLLPPIDYLGRPAQVWPTDINDAGQVIGLAIADSDPEKPFVWTAAGGFTFLPTIPGGEYGYMHVNSINKNGVIVGEALDFTDMTWKGFMWDTENGIQLLESLVDAPANFMIEYARDINENGWIVGSGHFGPGWATQRGYVLQPVAQTVPGDLNNDGVVDGADLLILLSAWGKCADPDNCPADLNDDGTVDGADLLILLSNWG